MGRLSKRRNERKRRNKKRRKEKERRKRKMSSVKIGSEEEEEEKPCFVDPWDSSPWHSVERFPHSRKEEENGFKKRKRKERKTASEWIQR
jgi:hypothetical protein